MRMHIGLCVLGGVMVLLLSNSYNGVVLSAVVLGYALSSLFPQAMTVLSDYGYVV